jgi:hypothetical protein
MHTDMRHSDYKLRTHIAKHLRSRSKTIKTTLNTYNRAVIAIGQHSDRLDFNKVIAQEFLYQFDLLRLSRTDIRTKLWAEINNQLLCNSYFKVKQASEEI